MTIYKLLPAGKTLYGLTTGIVYKPQEDSFVLWRAGGRTLGTFQIFAAEPDGVTDVRPFKVGDTVSTVEDLEALPSDTILRAAYGDVAYQKVNTGFYSVRSMARYSAAEMTAEDECTVVWLPETGERA